MKIDIPLISVIAALTIGGCSVPKQGDSDFAARSDSHFTCAAIIGAADQLITSSQVTADPTIMREGLNSAMQHMNAWAVPERIPEAQAFDQVKAERQRLISSLPTAEILKRARACIDQTKSAKV